MQILKADAVFEMCLQCDYKTVNYNVKHYISFLTLYKVFIMVCLLLGFFCNLEKSFNLNLNQK